MKGIYLTIIAIYFLATVGMAAAQGGPSVGVTTQDREGASSRREIQRDKSVETRRWQTESSRHGNESRQSQDSGTESRASAESRQGREQQRSVEISIDLGQIGARLLARAEQDPSFTGPVGEKLQQFKVFSSPRIPVMEPYMTFNPGGDMGKLPNYKGNWPRSRPDATIASSAYSQCAGYGLSWRTQPTGLHLQGDPPFFRYLSSGPNFMEIQNFSASYILGGLLLRDSLGLLQREYGGQDGAIYLREGSSPAEELYRAMQAVSLSSPWLLQEAGAMTVQATTSGCDVVTTAGFIGGRDDLRCGPLVIAPREHRVSLAGQPVIGSQIMGRSYTMRVAVTSSVGHSTSSSSSASTSQSSSTATYSSYERGTEASSSASMRRSSSVSSSAETSSSTDTSTGLTAAPQ